MGGQRHSTAALPPGRIPNTHCIGGWVGPRAGLYGSEKSRSPLAFDPRAFQPVASSCADCAIVALRLPLLTQLMKSLLFQIAQHLNSLSRDVAVGVVTGLWCGRPGNCGLIPGWDKRLSFRKCPVFCSVVSGVSYSGIKRPRREAVRPPGQHNCEIKSGLK